MTEPTNIEIAPNTQEEERDADPATPAIGKWYWVNRSPDEDEDEPDRWLACVVHVGSNYVKVEGPSETYADSRSFQRIHFDNFWKVCEYEPDATSVIQQRVGGHQRTFNQLMGKVKDVTARLGVVPSPELGEGAHTQALATRTGEPIPKYREALVKASKEELPELFKKMNYEADMMASWMKCEVIPLRGQQGQLKKVIGKVDSRIVAVDLYAGLSEEAEQVRKGKPAAIGEPLHLLQRRHYMDEECLANYKAGGMEFKDLRAFDRWLAKNENRDRIMPFPRCMVAFMVRREDKGRECVTIHDFFRILGLKQADKQTFLYIRNGAQVWRINTLIDFGEKLFPDFERQKLLSGQKLWAKCKMDSIGAIITDDRYQGMLEDFAAAKKWWKKLSKKEKEKNWSNDPHSFHGDYKDIEDYERFDEKSVFYDDVAQKISKAIESHNRIATILQGLFDRSQILKPHPPWKIWTDDGFNQALRLIYDEDMALVAGEKPDFEAYRKRLNESLKNGSVTVGQADFWERKEAKKENDRLSSDWRVKNAYLHHSTHFSPYGNPGPGLLAVVTRYQPRAKKCGYHWMRKRQNSRYVPFEPQLSSHIRTTVTVPASRVLNVDAYKPGDFHIFFDDPRTRMEYLKWAPLLLVAEDYHAGKRKVGPADER